MYMPGYGGGGRSGLIIEALTPTQFADCPISTCPKFLMCNSKNQKKLGKLFLSSSSLTLILCGGGGERIGIHLAIKCDLNTKTDVNIQQQLATNI